MTDKYILILPKMSKLTNLNQGYLIIGKYFIETDYI